MPAQSVRPCTYPGCSTLVTKGRCEKHPYPDRSSRNPKYDTAAWQRLRSAKLRDTPWCECENHYGRGIMVPAQCVDHKDGNADNDAPENLQSLTLACHAMKTATQDGGFGNRKGKPRPAVGVDGWPVRGDR